MNIFAVIKIVGFGILSFISLKNIFSRISDFYYLEFIFKKKFSDAHNTDTKNKAITIILLTAGLTLFIKEIVFSLKELNIIF